MVLNHNIVGRTVDLRPVEVSDAEFILTLRNSPLGQYLHPIKISLKEEVEWIKAQRERAGDYFFIIQDKSGKRIGTVGLKDVAGDCGETSRFISQGSPVQNTEANLLIMDFAFDDVGIERMEGSVAAENRKMLSLQKKFGFVFDDNIIEMDGIMVHRARIERAFYKEKRPKIDQLVQSASLIGQSHA